MSELLERAQQYQEEKADRIPDDQRPSYHFTSPIGWINDPNGWSVYRGEYHLFFQYHPYSTHWGPMHWGHAKTVDLIKWLRMPIAMAPDMPYDDHGCFSGSAIEKNGMHILMYTGVCEEENGNKTEVIQSQCLAIGDGIHYAKMEDNPVITSKMLPAGCDVGNFRDPKIWLKNGMYYAVIGSKKTNNEGHVVVFRSKDLKKWEYVHSVDQAEHRYGVMWECPDLFQLDGRDVLITSPQFMEAEGLEFHNGNGTLCIIGTLDTNNKFVSETQHAVDYGLDFYAPQTLEAPDGRRLMIAWMQSWDNYITPEEFEWSGIMSIPRELTVKNNRLYQYPVHEIEMYRKNKFAEAVTVVDGESNVNLIRGRQIDLVVKIIKVDCDRFDIKLACGKGYFTKLTYEPKKDTITFDRTYSGLHKDVQCRRNMSVSPFCGEMEIRILMDKYTIEIFVEGGKYAMSSLIYTNLDADGISFCSDGKVQLMIEKYDVEVRD